MIIMGKGKFPVGIDPKCLPNGKKSFDELTPEEQEMAMRNFVSALSLDMSKKIEQIRKSKKLPSPEFNKLYSSTQEGMKRCAKLLLGDDAFEPDVEKPTDNTTAVRRKAVACGYLMGSIRGFSEGLTKIPSNKVWLGKIVKTLIQTLKGEVQKIFNDLSRMLSENPNDEELRELVSAIGSRMKNL